jgi:hypothetical protein
MAKGLVKLDFTKLILYNYLLIYKGLLLITPLLSLAYSFSYNT